MVLSLGLVPQELSARVAWSGTEVFQGCEVRFLYGDKGAWP